MKKFISIFMLILTIINITGCKGTKQEIEKLAVILAAGFDLTPEGKYMVTVQILNPQKDSSSNIRDHTMGGQLVSTDVIIYNTTGNSPIDAVNELSIELDKDLFWGQNKFSVLGKELAESGLSLFIDASLRGSIIRPELPLLTTKDKAANIISAVTTSDITPANTVDNLINIQSSMGFSPVISRMDFANALTSKTSSPILGVIKLNKSQYSGETFEIAGTAVFKKDKLIGYLDKNQTRGMQWIKGNVKSGTITTNSYNNKIITFDILTSKSNIKPIIKNDSAMIEVTIKESGNIRELAEELDPMKNYQLMDELTVLQNEAIEKEVKLALNAAQKKLNADIFDFGGIIYRNYPEIWKKLEKNWEDIFPNLEVEIKVNSSLKRPGIISKPMKK